MPFGKSEICPVAVPLVNSERQWRITEGIYSESQEVSDAVDTAVFRAQNTRAGCPGNGCTDGLRKSRKLNAPCGLDPSAVRSAVLEGGAAVSDAIERYRARQRSDPDMPEDPAVVKPRYSPPRKGKNDTPPPHGSVCREGQTAYAAALNATSVTGRQLESAIKLGDQRYLAEMLAQRKDVSALVKRLTEVADSCGRCTMKTSVVINPNERCVADKLEPIIQRLRSIVAR